MTPPQVRDTEQKQEGAARGAGELGVEEDPAGQPATGIAMAPEPPRPTLLGFDNRLSVVDCGRALASLTWIWNRTRHESHFLFGTIDLVPDELPLVDCPVVIPCVSLGKKSEWRVYFADHHVATNDAFRWYQDLVRRGEWGAAWLDRKIKKATPVHERLMEPAWPHTVLLGSSKSVPFASQRKAATRAHHLLVTSSPVLELLGKEEVKRLQEAMSIKRQLDFEKYPHLYQSAHLFVPMPILRRYDTRLDSNGSGDRAILVNLVPRVGQQLDGLTIEVLEKRPTGRRLLAHSRVSTPFTKIALMEDVEQISIRVIHDDLGLLADDGPYTFLQGIATTVKIITRHRRPSDPERGGRPAQQHKIPVAGMEQKMLTGSERAMSAARLLQGAESKAKRTGSGKQLWFRNAADAAQEHIRKLLGNASSRVVLLDPYFIATEVQRYVPWAAGRDVEILVLTSTKGLREISHAAALGNDGKEKKAQRELNHLMDLQAELDRCLSARLINPTSVRVMTGDDPIHDRFMIIDDKAWLLGSSLNAFGTRGTMMVELEHAQEVIPELLKYATETASKSLEHRVAHLRAPTQPVPQE
jgi:hypothetical protein